MAASNSSNFPEGQDPAAASGDWLYRHQELVLGPVPAPLIVEKLYTGELTGQNEVARAGSSDFRRIAELDAFRFHLARAEAKLRVDAAAREEQARARKGRNVRLAVVGVVGLVLTIGAVVAARYVAIHNPFKAEGDEFAGISVDPPVIGLARNRVSDEELLEYPGLVPGVPKVTPPTEDASAAVASKTTPPADAKKPEPEKLAAATRTTKKIAAKTATPPPTKAATTTTTKSTDADGLATETSYDQEAIYAVVRAKQKSLFPCLAEEAKRRPGFSAKVPIEFVIGNDGKVAKLWVDHPELKTGPLSDCMLRELQKWRFKAYDGERATIGLSFRIGQG